MDSMGKEIESTEAEPVTAKDWKEKEVGRYRSIDTKMQTNGYSVHRLQLMMNFI